MAIPVKLEAFEGPLDLLLHLIDKNKINIYDIPIALITEQYMEYLNAMDKQDLDNMSEFLVMAATLLKIKSKLLLPKEETKEEIEEDPRQELVERLLEYKMYKFASLELKDRHLEADKKFFKKKTIPSELLAYKEEIPVEDLLANISLAKLNHIFQSVIKKQTEKVDPIRSKFGKIEKEEVNLPKKMHYVQEYGLKHKTFSFRKLLETQNDKMEIVVTFLCILELMKLGRVRTIQEEIFDDIWIEYVAVDVIEIEDLQEGIA